MCSSQSENELLRLAARDTRPRTSISSTFNDIQDVVEGQGENEDMVERGDFESDEDFLVDKKKMKRKVRNKKKVKVSKSKTTHDASLTAPANDLALNATDPSSLKDEPVLRSTSDENTRMIAPLALAEPTVQEVANEYDIKIPNIVQNIDHQSTQLLYTQAPTENAFPSSTSHQTAKTVPCDAQNYGPGMMQGTNDIKTESIVGKGTKIMYMENTCTQPSPSSTTTSQQVVKTLPSQVKKLIPGQVGKNHGQPKAAKLPGGRGRSRNVRQAGPFVSARPKHFAPGAPRPARLPRMLRPSLPSSRFRQIRPRIPGYSGTMSQPHTPTVSPVSRPRMNHGLSSTRPLQRGLLTHEPQPVDPPLVIELDTDTSPQHDHTVAPITTTPIPNLVLPPSISITRTPQAYRTDSDNISTTNITSFARALVKLGDTEGKKCLVLYEITESQIEGLRDLGLKERRI